MNTPSFRVDNDAAPLKLGVDKPGGVGRITFRVDNDAAPLKPEKIM